MPKLKSSWIRTAKHTGQEPGTLALYHFDALVDGSSSANSAQDSVLRSALKNLDAFRLSEGMPGFGKALWLGD